MRLGLRILGITALGAAFIKPSIRLNLAEANPTVKAFTQSIEKLEPPLREVSQKEAEVYPIVLTEKGKKWMEEQENIYQKTKNKQEGGLIDASTFLAPDQKKKLDWLSGQKGEVDGVELAFKKLDSEENGYRYVVDVDYGNKKKERWHISGQAYYKDQFPGGEPPSISALVIWKGVENGGVDKLTQNFLPYYRFGLVDIETNNIDFQYVLNKINEAKENRENEIRDAAKIKNFDLSKDEPIGYIGLAEVNDPLFVNSLNETKYFAEMLSSLDYQMVSNEEGRYAIGVNSPPNEIIENEIREFRRKGIKNIFLKLSGHGDKFGVYFTTMDEFGFDRPKVLSRMMLTDIFDKSPECNFVLFADPCSGGGISAAIKNYMDPTGQKGRITSFLESKIYATTQEGRLKGTNGLGDIPEICADYYIVFFLHHILSGRTYGEAHLLADQNCKELIGCDAEGWRSTPSGGISTAALNPYKVSFLKGMTYN